MPLHNSASPGSIPCDPSHVESILLIIETELTVLTCSQFSSDLGVIRGWKQWTVRDYAS